MLQCKTATRVARQCHCTTNRYSAARCCAAGSRCDARSDTKEPSSSAYSTHRHRRRRHRHALQTERQLDRHMYTILHYIILQCITLVSEDCTAGSPLGRRTRHRRRYGRRHLRFRSVWSARDVWSVSLPPRLVPSVFSRVSTLSPAIPSVAI